MKEEELRFCTEPGGEELGVMICARETGEVLRARGDTGVGRLLGVILDTSFCLKDSVLAGDEECLGEGVLLEEWPELSTPFLSLPRIRLMKDFFFIRPLPLELLTQLVATTLPWPSILLSNTMVGVQLHCYKMLIVSSFLLFQYLLLNCSECNSFIVVDCITCALTVFAT